ncbi:sigma-54-dependent Fis family transcriptional regulator [Paenarthrobacter sp. NPDC058040]|uniref:sigma-54-dependent Fis family transcriptional regulator n=1 Tax=unclassified Paenarthrobacter TaxID=2634190 RepID=UPI0036DBE142
MSIRELLGGHLSDGTGPADPEIRQSWYRSTLAGLHPGSDIVIDKLAEMNLQSRLMRAASPILEGLESQLHESQFGLLLADNEGYILHRTFGSQRMASASDRLGVVVGAQITEQTSGTNAISTPIETRRGVFVLGEQHFLECLRDQICFGLPIFQPGTRRLEGVINIMGPGRESPALMKPVLTSAVREIQQRLSNTYSDSQVALLLAFRSACENHRRLPVVAIEPSETFTNGPAASGLLDSDLEVLKEFAMLRGVDFGDRVEMDLSVGRRTVLVERVSEQGAVFRVLGNNELSPAVPRASVRYRSVGDELEEALAEARNANGQVLITGESGSGRTTAARSVASRKPFHVIDASEALLQGAEAWVLRLRTLAEKPETSVLVEQIQLLDPSLSQVLIDVMETAEARIVLTADTDQASIIPVGARCQCVVELPTLRERRPELASIVATMLSDRGVKNTRFSPAAITALAAHDWPGNYRELQRVLDEVLVARSVGDVSLGDLPARYRAPGRRRTLGLLEQAEFDAIRKVLSQVRGNKVQAAEVLGISRSTLYARMKALGLQ